MKKYNIYKFLFCIGLALFTTSCINEESFIPEDNQMSIHVSIKEGNAVTRASAIDSTEVLDIEKIHRYDIFMYNHETDAFCKHVGETLSTPKIEFTAKFFGEPTFSEDLDVYVVVNMAWKDKGDFSTITVDSLKSLAFEGKQNITGTKTDMTAFNGYKSGTDIYEPFIMSAATSVPHNFKTTPKLELELKRTYAKVVFVFTTNLSATDDPDWVGLKSMSIKQYKNIADTAKVFPDLSTTGFTPRTSDYTYTDAAIFSHDFNIDLTTADGKSNVYDTFLETTNKLRIFPHSAADAKGATALDISFGVGPVGDNKVTKVFNRRILIGTGPDYRIEPNTAYIVTIKTSKTDDEILVTTKVAPWNMVYADIPAEPLQQ